MRPPVEETREKGRVVCPKSLTLTLLMLIDRSAGREKNIIFSWFCSGTNAINLPASRSSECRRVTSHWEMRGDLFPFPRQTIRLFLTKYGSYTKFTSCNVNKFLFRYLSTFFNDPNAPCRPCGINALHLDSFNLFLRHSNEVQLVAGVYSFSRLIFAKCRSFARYAS